MLHLRIAAIEPTARHDRSNLVKPVSSQQKVNLFKFVTNCFIAVANGSGASLQSYFAVVMTL